MGSFVKRHLLGLGLILLNSGIGLMMLCFPTLAMVLLMFPLVYTLVLK